MADIEKNRSGYLRQLIPGVLNVGVSVLFFLCICGLVIYGTGSRFSDTSLVFILNILRYLSIVLAFMSICALIFTVRQTVQKKKAGKLSFFWKIMLIAAFLISGCFGLALMVLCNVIIVIAG